MKLELFQKDHIPSLMQSLVNGSHGQELKRSGSESQVAQPRRRRHLVFINSDHLSEDVAQEVSSRASTSEASSEVHTPQVVLLMSLANMTLHAHPGELNTCLSRMNSCSVCKEVCLLRKSRDYTIASSC